MTRVPLDIEQPFGAAVDPRPIHRSERVAGHSAVPNGDVVHSFSTPDGVQPTGFGENARELVDKRLVIAESAADDEVAEIPSIGGAAVSLRPVPGRANPGSSTFGVRESSDIHAEQLALRHALERAYPLAKQLAEILELEAI